MIKEKHGFVYIWRDKKYKKYYIGSHWGYETDSYICGSTNMRNNYYRRRKDFKRRIIKRIYTNRKDLLIEEQRFIDMIPISAFGTKYYNLSSNVLKSVWWMNETTKNIVAKRISQSHKTMEQRTGKKWGHWKKGTTFKHTPEAIKKITEASKNMTQETKDKISKSSLGRKHTEESKQKMSEIQYRLKVNLGRKHREETRKKISNGNKGKIVSHSEETRKKMSLSRKGRPGIKHTEESKQKLRSANLGKKHSEETRKKISEAQKGKVARNKGIPHTEKHKEKLKLAWIKRKMRNNGTI